MPASFRFIYYRVKIWNGSVRQATNGQNTFLFLPQHTEERSSAGRLLSSKPRTRKGLIWIRAHTSRLLSNFPRSIIALARSPIHARPCHFSFINIIAIGRSKRQFHHNLTFQMSSHYEHTSIILQLGRARTLKSQPGDGEEFKPTSFSGQAYWASIFLADRYLLLPSRYRVTYFRARYEPYLLIDFWRVWY